MYICLECGEVFESCSEWAEPHGEDMCGCPYCGGAFEIAMKCNICGKYHLEDDLINGICEDCAKSNFEYETALKYLVETKQLRHFFLVWYWNVANSVSDDENEEFDKTLISVFNAKVQEDKENFRTTFYSQLKEYIFDDIYDWTEFLAKEEKK